MNKFRLKFRDLVACIMATVLVAVAIFTLDVQIAVAANATVSGTLQNYQGKGKCFRYFETKYGNAGGGNRGIRILVVDGKRDQTYKFSPNPHDNPWYNKHQFAFYTEAAESLATFYLDNRFRFPRYGDFSTNIHNVEYEFVAPT